MLPRAEGPPATRGVWVPQVCPATAFSDSLQQADAIGLLSMTAGGMVIYPAFRRPSSDAPACTRQQQQGHARSASMDLHEEACRRQAFFERAGQQMLSKENGAPPGHCEAQRFRCSLLPANLWCTISHCICVSELMQGHITAVLAYAVTCSVHAPTGAGEASSTAGEAPPHKRRMALFSRMRSGGRYWFNTRQQWSPALERQYQWAGWLLGQCFANRTSLRVMLPDVLFEKLLKGPAFQVWLAHPL